jgi:hypothetical protein
MQQNVIAVGKPDDCCSRYLQGLFDPALLMKLSG